VLHFFRYRPTDPCTLLYYCGQRAQGQAQIPSPNKPQQRTRLISTTSIGSHRGLVQESLCAAAELRGSALPPALGLTSRL
jgi:hypothetical protein